MRSGPMIESLTRRLAECPPEFLAEPRLRGKKDGVSVAAVVSDLLEDLGAPGPLSEKGAAAWEQTRAQDRNLLRLTLVASWLCHDAWLVEDKRLAEPVRHWLTGGLRPMAELVTAELFVTDADRREELARSLLAALELAPKGETAEQCSDRLKALSSVERSKVIRDTRAKEEAARKLRAQMEAEAARQAAARYGSE